MALPQILALDLGTAVGWACGSPDGEPRYNTMVLPSTGEDIGRFALAFNNWLNDTLDVEKPGLVVFEAPVLTGRTSLATARKLYGLAWQTELCCHVHGIRCMEHHLQSVKKFFTGNGRAEKPEMMAAARRQGWNPKSFDAADALGLWACVVHEKAPRFAERFRAGALSQGALA